MARNSCFWVLGRGASIANGLNWAVPHDFYDKLICGAVSREQVIDWIKRTLCSEMDEPTVHNDVYCRFIAELANRTASGWYHRFLTTNWDTLLEREMPASGAVKNWLGGQSHVFHLNGSIERVPPDVERLRSSFLLECDPPDKRVEKLESNKAFVQLCWHAACVVMVGLSFGCRTDQNFLNALNRVQDDLPIGEATVYVVNPGQSALEEVCERIREKLPSATVLPIAEGFDTFVEGGLAPLNGTVLTSSSWWCRLTSFILR